MTTPTPHGAPELLPCPFCGDDGEKGRQTVTQMNEARTTFDRILCRCCGAMAPEQNWQSRAAIQQAAGAVDPPEPQGPGYIPRFDKTLNFFGGAVDAVLPGVDKISTRHCGQVGAHPKGHVGTVCVPVISTDAAIGEVGL